MIVQGAVHDANQPSMLPYTMSKATKLPLNSLNDFLTCKLCRGYYIDASTIIECLHSFCRSCIVKYLEKNKYCPICDVQVHKTKPLINIRQDKILQSIVYKLVPRLFQNEMLRRKCFYASHPEEKKDLDVEELGEASYQHILAPDENICVALNYKDSPLTPRYLQCSAALSIFHLQKLIRSKYDLSSNHRIDIFHGDDILNSCLTLIDVAYSSLWRRKGPLELTYRIFESTLSPTANINFNSPSDDNISTNNNNNNASNDWKEVQIQISENGEMSVTGIQDCLQLLDNMDDLEEPIKTTSNKKDSVNTEDRLDLKPLKNNSKITKVELNQPPSQNSQLNTADVVMLDTPLLPALTLTVAELKELSKIEEAAKTQASDTLPSPPPAKKLKKELPELKSIGSNKMQKKNGAKSTSPQATEENVTESTITIAKQTINSSIPVNSSKNVIVTSTITIPPCSTQEQVAAIASTTNSTAIVISTSTVAMPTSTSTIALATSASTVLTTPSTSTVATKTSGSAIAMTTSAMTTLASTVAMTTSTSTASTALSTVAMTTPTAITTSTSSTTGAVKLSTPDTSVAAASSLSSNSSTVPNISNISNINNVKTSCTNTSVSTSNTVLTPSNTSIITGAGKLATSSITSVTISKPIITATAVALSSPSVNTTLKTSTSASKRKHPSSTATPTLSDHKLPKPTILNHSLGLQKSLNLSKNHPLTTKHQKAVETAAKVANNPVSLLNIQNQANNSKWNAGVSLKSYGTLINVPKVPAAQTSQVNKQQATPACTSTTTITHLPSSAITTVTASMLDGKQQTNIDSSSVLMIKSKASTPIGYKTLKDPPKTWNPTLHHKVGPQLGGTAAKPGDLKNVRPAKFFKMRNNMPRYLGCPNSGVKPMFQVQVSPEKEKSNVPETTSTPTQLTSSHTTTPSIITTTTSVASAQSLHLTTPVIVTLPSSSPAPQSIKPVEQQIRKHSIVKIDPKTLKPISEKAPESSNLSTKSTVSGSSTSKSLVVGRGDQPQKGGGLNSCQGKKQEEQQQSAVGSKGSYELRDLEKRKSASPHQSDQSTSRTHQLASPTTASATSTSNLNLRINTTSVSITNPLKKSPHSPKKSTSPPNQQNHNQSTKSNQSIKPIQTPPPSTTSPSINRDKPPQLNQQPLNYTPSNPFIPNPLASPTLNPNQFNFLTAAVAATQGFHHGYDPRYHHHLPYHHQLYPPRLPPFAPPQVGNWWGSPPPASTLAVGQQVPLSGSSANRNSSPRGLIWNGPSADNNVCSPKEAKTATSATMDSKTNLDVLLPRSSSKKEPISISSTNNKSTAKETNLIDSAHERKEDNKSKQTSATAKIAMPKEKPLPDVEDKGKIVVVETANDQAAAVNKESKSTSETQSEKSEKLTQKNTSTDTAKENVVLAVT